MPTNKVFEKLKAEFKDIDREIVNGDAIVQEKIDVDMQARIARQVEDEYQASERFNEEKRATNLARLKLYNNQRRDRSAVGDPLMFTVFNTVLSSLYVDRLMALWEGRGGEDDEDIEENLNALSNFDYDVMGKDELDYFWDWDSLFFGRGIELLMEFDRTKGIMAPSPEVIDPMTFIRDPRASSVNGLGLNMKGAMRFGGWEVGSTYWELKDSPGYFNIDSLRKEKELQTLIDDARQARDEAQGRDRFYPDEEGLGERENYEYQLLNWFTTIKGERYLVTLGNRRSTIIRLMKLKYGQLWPLIDRPLFPTSNDWDGVSIPDITEDKQRARAKLLNLGVKSAVIDALPQYMYDRTRIKNKNELNWESNKFIGVDGPVNDAMLPVQKSVVHQYVNVIMDMLDQSTQRALAASEMQQGVPQDDKRTLGELQMVTANADARRGMNAKIFGWSEKRFWQQWYRMYKLHFKEGIDEKVVRIQGPMAPVFRPLTKDNIIAVVDPDVKIESLVISEAKRIREQQSYDQFAAIAIQDPETDRRFIYKRMAKLRGMVKEEIEAIFPPTVDEEQAKRENELLNEGELPAIDPRDDHRVHIRVHAKANQTPEARAHIRMHEELSLQVRNHPELFPQEQAQQFQPPPGLGPRANAPVVTAPEGTVQPARG
jgi:hypothetical protein